MAVNDVMQLKTKIIQRFGSLHAFARTKPNGLSRSTIYAVLSGKYNGNFEMQYQRIKDALLNQRANIFDVLKKVACACCEDVGHRDKRCEKCFELWRIQEKALLKIVSPGENNGKT